MNTAIVSTSINPFPPAYMKWAEQGDLFVAGDLNSPPSLEVYVKELGGTYITPAEQEVWSFSDAIGWNCIQRRNAAVMQAYADGYDRILTVDDDNFPDPDFVQRHADRIGRKAFTALVAPWIDIGKFVEPPTTQRGMPYGLGEMKHELVDPHGSLEIAVSQAHILGTPDCDAITRILDDPQVITSVIDATIMPGSWTPFNSQATMWAGQWAPFIACLPGEVDRHDDIWASLIAQRVMRVHDMAVYVGTPYVTQHRNAHDPVSDLRRELYGMHRTLALVERLNRLGINRADELPTAYRKCAHALSRVLPSDTFKFMLQWADEWKKILR